MPDSAPSAAGPPPPRTWAERRAATDPRLAPLHRVEWAFEWLVYGLQRAAIIDFFKLLATFTLPVALVSYLLGGDDREREYLFRTWAVVASARGQRANGARDEALQDLTAHGFSLAGVDLVGARLEGLDLRGADLRDVRLDSASLVQSRLGCRREGFLWHRRRCGDLRGAVLRGANLRGLDLRDVPTDSANFEGAELAGTQLSLPHLTGISLQRTRYARRDLRGANLAGAALDYADLDSTQLDGAVLTDADLWYASLRGTSLRGARLRLATFRNTDVAGARLDSADLTDAEFLESDFSAVSLRGATLPAPRSMERTTLCGADLRGADLRHSGDSIGAWRGVRSLRGANVWGVRNAPPGWMRWAVDSMGAVDAEHGQPARTAAVLEAACADSTGH